MLYSLTRTRLLCSKNTLSLRLIRSSWSISISTRASLQLPRRAFSSIPSSPRNELFNYTSGRWLVNNNLRLAERKHEFDDGELRRLAAQSVDRMAQDVANMEKLAEGGFNRIFLITMHDGFQMVARVPYPVTQPKSYAVASEVATMAFLGAHRLPVPKVYGYSPTSDNAAKTEYIFMEFVKGTKFADVWMNLKEADLASVLRQLVQLESIVMSIPFWTGGSLYYADDLEKLAGEKTGIPMLLNGERFCVGPDVRLHMWYGRRSQLDVNRGPHENAEAVLITPAHKEIAYLERFGRPLLPFQRERRDPYDYKEQSPLDHIKNLERYLLMASSLIPKDPSLQTFCLRHPDLSPSNIMVSTSADSGQLEIVSLLDWQHASILPRFLNAGIPDRFQNYDDPVSQSFLPPLFPTNAHEMEESELMRAVGRHHARLVHYHYDKNTYEFNKPHQDAVWDPACVFIRRLWDRAGSPWEGDNHDLKALLIEATEKWERLVGASVQCPVAFKPDDVSQTKTFGERLQSIDEMIETIRGAIGYGGETWVPCDDYEEAKAVAETMKQKFLAVYPEGELRDNLEANWFLDDMDETDYM